MKITGQVPQRSLVLVGATLLASLLPSAAIGGEVAVVGTECIRCPVSGGPGGQDLLDCSLASPNIELLQRQDVDSDFYVSYVLTCNMDFPSPRPSHIVVQVGAVGVSLYLNDAKMRQYVGAGLGPLMLTDRNPDDLKTLQFSNGCSLKFSEIIAAPSKATQDAWRVEITEKEEQLRVESELLHAYGQIAELAPGFSVLKTLLEHFESKAEIQGLALAEVAKLVQCKEGEKAPCGVLRIILNSKTDIVTFEEKVDIARIAAKLSGLASGHPADAVTENDKNMLAGIVAKDTLVSEMKAKLQTTAKRVEELGLRIKVLRSKLR